MGFSEQARLSELHRLAQSRLQAVVSGDVASAFSLLDPANVDRTFGNYYGGMKKLLTARRTVSSSLSASLFSEIRKDAKIMSSFTPILDAALNEKALFTSLLVTGPISIKRSLATGASIEQAQANALSSTIRASQRHVANGGRGTIINATKRDDRAKGWARLTDSKPCAFCAMLASRGPAYKSEITAVFRSHDGCGCSAVPVFDLSAPWPGRAEEFREAYDQNISGKFAGGDGNNDAVKAWKAFYDSKINPDAFNQARNVATELVSRATAAESQLTSLMQDLSTKYDGELKGLQYRLKTSESLTRKISKDVAESHGTLTVDQVGSKMFDVNRYTMQLSDDGYVSGAQSIIDDLRAGGSKVNVKNYWTAKDNPYQGINLQVTGPNGIQYELQIHTAQSLEVKEGALHSIYEKSRKTKDALKLAKYSEESFAAAAEIPVPRGVEGILWGQGDAVEVVKKVTKKAAKTATAPGWRSAWEMAKAKLPEDASLIGRSIVPGAAEAVSTKEFLIAEARIRAHAQFVDNYTKAVRKKARTSEDYAEKRRTINSLLEAYGKSIGMELELKLNLNAVLNAERASAKAALDALIIRKAGGEVDVVVGKWAGGGEVLLPGAKLEKDLDAILEAGAALGAELDRRIAQRLLTAVPSDGAAAALELAAKRAVMESKLAKVDAEILKWQNDPVILAKAEKLATDRLIRDPDMGKTFEELKDYYQRNLLTYEDKFRRLANKKNKLKHDFQNEVYRSERTIRETSGSIEIGSIPYADIQREEVLKLLAEIREMGGQGATYVNAAGRPLTKGVLTDAMQFAHSSYPAAWMKIVRERYPSVELGKLARGHNGDGIEIKLSEGAIKVAGDLGYNGVAVHELGHSMQYAIPGLRELDWAYRSRRGMILEGGEPVLERVTTIYQGNQAERGIKDSWRTPYSGKVYNANTSKEVGEVFTTGAESLLSGSPYFNPVSSILEPDAAKLLFDKEFRDYMLGVLSVL